MSSCNTYPIGRGRRRITMVVCAGAVAVVGSVVASTSAVATTPDDSTPDSAPAGSAAAAEIRSIAVTVTDTSIDGLPTDLVAGVVEVTVTTGENASPEVTFTRVEPGTDAATFAADLMSVNEGGPFPDYILNMAGAAGHSMLALDEGEYIVWAEPAGEVESAEDIITAPLTVGPGDDDAVIPPTDGGSIRAGDYLFDADVSAGGTIVTFTNSSDNQFHHVVLIDFGTNDPALVEENIPALLESEGEGPAPEGIDMAQVNDEFGGSGVFGPGGSGTFDATFEAGNTYVAICFISDREGGLPHAIQHQMYDVFQVGAG